MVSPHLAIEWVQVNRGNAEPTCCCLHRGCLSGGRAAVPPRPRIWGGLSLCALHALASFTALHRISPGRRSRPPGAETTHPRPWGTPLRILAPIAQSELPDHLLGAPRGAASRPPRHGPPQRLVLLPPALAPRRSSSTGLSHEPARQQEAGRRGPGGGGSRRRRCRGCAPHLLPPAQPGQAPQPAGACTHTRQVRSCSVLRSGVCHLMVPTCSQRRCLAGHAPPPPPQAAAIVAAVRLPCLAPGLSVRRLAGGSGTRPASRQVQPTSRSRSRSPSPPVSCLPDAACLSSLACTSSIIAWGA